MSGLKDTLSAFGQAHKFIWQEGFLKMLSVPLLLTVLYFPVMVGACYFSAVMFVEFFEDQLGLDGDYGGWVWVEWLVEIVLFFGIGLLGIITYRTVVLLFYSLYLDRIAERVEKAVTGEVAESKRPPTHVLSRMIVVAIITIVGTVLMLMIELGANLIPVLGGLIALALVIPCEMFLTGIGFIDPYFDRAGLTGMQSFRIMRQRFFTIGAFSVIGSLIVLIPFVGWFLGPTYSVVAGIIIAMNIHSENRVDADK
ncbi:MAG: EI24 domain-containing protein [Verrucomicrobiota bacterium]|nr:EI24 domain-containing protein [Verrucomicrobiota bacterium]